MNLGDTSAGIVGSGPLLLAVLVAALAGLISFLSPCVLPLMPGYLSYVTGLAGADLDAGRRRGRILAGTALFVAGFASVFITVNILATAATQVLLTNLRLVQIVGGVLIIGLGVALLGWIPLLQRQWQIRSLPTAGLLGAPVFGAVFGLSWVPCAGPALGAVTTLSAVGGSLPRAVLLASAYCLGLGLPFVGVGLGLPRLLGLLAVIRRHGRWVTMVGAVMLIAVGVALISGAWEGFVTWLRVSVPQIETPI